ncbi:MAG TPA: ester cyclase [Candidatus Saccharimonadales bacterium]|nr:ester cyclase [Candidatus Saccharimonadales bacterium]
MLDSNKKLVERHFTELLSGDNLDACEEIIATDYVEHAWAPFGNDEPGKVNGPQSTRETVGWLKAQFPDMKMIIEAIVADGDLVVARVLSEGTNTGKLNGVAPATNKKFSARQCHWYRIKDGKLCEHWAVRDDLTAMLQLGAVKRPGPPAFVKAIRKLTGKK